MSNFYHNIHLAGRFIPQFKPSGLLWFALISGFALSLTTGLNAETKTEYWKRSNEVSSRDIDHQSWQAILDRYLVSTDPSQVNLFSYNKVTDDDKKRLNDYLTSMQNIDPRSYSKSQQKSYWINLYNALTLRLIIRNYPVKSITKLGEGFFSFGPWDDDAAVVAQQTLSLNDIEHKILRPIWQDPRVHYAVNCASYSCPNLSSKAFTAQNIELLLEQGANNYINHPRGVTVQGNDLLLSSIYKWYREDFGNNQAALINHLSHYAAPALKRQLTAFEQGNGDINYDYDWRLNEEK